MLEALFRLQRYKIKCIYARVDTKKCAIILISALTQWKKYQNTEHQSIRANLWREAMYR